MSDQPTAEDRFRTAQARLLVASGTRAVSRMIRVRETWVHVIEAGSGRPVVLVHGGGRVAATWEPLLGLLQESLHLFAPDRPGCGLTDKLSYRGIAFRDHAVGWLAGVIDSLGLDRVSLVGSSMGGYWALAFALAHPERLHRLVLAGAPAGSAPRTPLARRPVATPGLGGAIQATMLAPNRARTRRRVARLVAHPERLQQPLLDVVHAGSVLPGAGRAWLTMTRLITPAVGRARLTYALRDELRGLRVPTLLVWGERDPSPPRVGEELCNLLPDARLEVVADAGHLVWLDEPEATAGVLHEFLEPTARLAVRDGSEG